MEESDLTIEEITKRLNEEFVEFHWGYILDDEKVGIILDERSQDNIKDGEPNYTLVMRIIFTEYEHYYLVVPFERVESPNGIDKTFKMNETRFKIGDSYTKDEIRKLIIQNDVFKIAVSAHFYHPDYMTFVKFDKSDVTESGEPNEFVAYYKDTDPDKKYNQYRLVQYDYLGAGSTTEGY